MVSAGVQNKGSEEKNASFSLTYSIPFAILRSYAEKGVLYGENVQRARNLGIPVVPYETTNGITYYKFGVPQPVASKSKLPQPHSLDRKPSVDRSLRIAYNIFSDTSLSLYGKAAVVIEGRITPGASNDLGSKVEGMSSAEGWDIAFRSAEDGVHRFVLLDPSFYGNYRNLLASLGYYIGPEAERAAQRNLNMRESFFRDAEFDNLIEREVM